MNAVIVIIIMAGAIAIAHFMIWLFEKKRLYLKKDVNFWATILTITTVMLAAIFVFIVLAIANLLEMPK